ncbi:MAG: patatin-like phospholipase family protein [Bacteroidales bacterium]|nr:patatin-like phospholipase family protein [Bacteroidales bacterium]
MKKNVALVLSGGGARGIAHIGVIEELEKQGFEIKSISGTSMGALVGGIYATGKMQEYKNWMYTLNKLEVFNLVDFNIGIQGLIKGDRVFKKMKEFIPDRNIEDLEIPYAAVAADIINNKEVVFTEGSVYNAVRASVAIPTVFTPVKTDEGLLVDGGVVNNIPVNRVKRTPDDILVVVNVSAHIPVYKPIISEKERDRKESVYQKKVSEFKNHLQKINPLNNDKKIGYFDLINKTINLMIYHNAYVSFEQQPPDIMIEVSHNSCGTMDFYKAEEMVEIGRYAAIRSLDKYNKKLV